MLSSKDNELYINGKWAARFSQTHGVSKELIERFFNDFWKKLSKEERIRFLKNEFNFL